MTNLFQTLKDRGFVSQVTDAQAVSRAMRILNARSTASTVLVLKTS